MGYTPESWVRINQNFAYVASFLIFAQIICMLLVQKDCIETLKVENDRENITHATTDC